MYDKLSLLPRPDIFLVGFAVNNPNSLKNAQEKWIPKVRQHFPSNPCILIATKVELRDDSIIRLKMKSCLLVMVILQHAT